MEQIDYDRKFAALTGTPENHKLDEFIDKHYASDLMRVDFSIYEGWAETVAEEPPFPE